MLPNKIAFIDIETSGTSLRNDHIIEVGILRVEDQRITETFESLINPCAYIPDFIEQLTGINQNQLESAPSFSSVQDHIFELLKGCIIVAHNVRFDYGFLRYEFKRHDRSFIEKHLCTVKLSQHLFPQYQRHNLDSIIDRFGISCLRRHRAFDDAKVLFDFYSLLKDKIGEEKLAAAIATVLRQPSRPLHITTAMVEALPESPGVYIFYGEDNTPLYVGKSINIKERILSHFANDHTSATEMKISQQIHHIETKITAGELSALILESKLVKQLQPLYNRKLRQSRRMIIAKIVEDKQKYNTIALQETEKIHPQELDTLVGVFPSKKRAQTFLRTISNEYKLCQKLLGIDHSLLACFPYRLDWCNGGCIGKEDPLRYNIRFQTAISSHKIKSWPFSSPVVITEVNELDQM